MIPVGLRSCEFGWMRKGVMIFPKKWMRCWPSCALSVTARDEPFTQYSLAESCVGELLCVYPARLGAAALLHLRSSAQEARAATRRWAIQASLRARTGIETRIGENLKRAGPVKGRKYLVAMCPLVDDCCGCGATMLSGFFVRELCHPPASLTCLRS
jgi:hypothetical protein